MNTIPDSVTSETSTYELYGQLHFSVGRLSNLIEMVDADYPDALFEIENWRLELANAFIALEHTLLQLHGMPNTLAELKVDLMERGAA